MKNLIAALFITLISNANTFAFEGQTPLVNAVIRADTTAVSSLLTDPSIDPNLPGYMGMTPLMVAAQMGLSDVVATLAASSKVEINKRVAESASCIVTGKSCIGFSALDFAVLEENSEYPNSLSVRDYLSVQDILKNAGAK